MVWESVSSMNELVDEISWVSEVVKCVGGDVDVIVNLLQVIENIVEQINLLVLNVVIEVV